MNINVNVDIPPGFVTAMELAELAETKAETARRRCRAAGVKELKLKYGEHRRKNKKPRFISVFEQRAAMYAVLEKMKISEKYAVGQRYRYAFAELLKLSDNSKSAYEKTILEECLLLLKKAKKAALQNK